MIGKKCLRNQNKYHTVRNGYSTNVFTRLICSHLFKRKKWNKLEFLGLRFSIYFFKHETIIITLFEFQKTNTNKRVIVQFKKKFFKEKLNFQR